MPLSLGLEWGTATFPTAHPPLSREGKGKGCFPQTFREWKASGNSPEEVTKDAKGGWPFFPTAATQSGPAGVMKAFFPGTLDL